MINEKSASISSRASRSCDIYITVGLFNTEQARSIVFKKGGGANSYKKSSRAKIIIIIINLNLLFYMQMMRNLKKIINCLKLVLCKWSLRNKQEITICRCVLLHFCASSQIMEQLYQLFKQTSIFLGEPQISIHTIILCPKIFS